MAPLRGGAGTAAGEHRRAAAVVEAGVGGGRVWGDVSWFGLFFFFFVFFWGEETKGEAGGEGGGGDQGVCGEE